MRYRRLDAQTGDYVFGQAQTDFFIDQPEAVAQLVLTRLMLWRGRWFADLTEGVPWATEVLGERTRWTRDVVVRGTVQDTPGVTDIVQYASHTDVDIREWQAAMILDTAYGAVALRSGRLPAEPPPLIDLPEVTPARADELGIIGGTPLSMTPANLQSEGRVNVADFVIQRVDSGAY